MHRFYISSAAVGKQTVHFDEQQTHQMRRVLRLSPGDIVTAFDGTGVQYQVELEGPLRKRAGGRIVETRPLDTEPRTQLTLYQSLLKRDKFEWVLQKATELGVACIVPTITRRSLVRDADKLTPQRLARWQRIVIEASEQSGRGRVPAINPVLSFDEALAESQSSSVAFIAWEAEGPAGLRSVLAEGTIGQDVALFVGPEGGYEVDEIEQAKRADVRPFTLGKRILRTETAAVVATALILYELEDMA